MDLAKLSASLPARNPSPKHQLPHKPKWQYHANQNQSLPVKRLGGLDHNQQHLRPKPANLLPKHRQQNGKLRS
jgi:hypothetical protein